MSSTNKTENYNLSQFVGTDIPSILNDYNGDMQKIDTAVHNVSVASGDNASDIAILQSTVSGHTNQIAQIDRNVTAVSGRVLNVESKITNIENDIAEINSNFDKIQLTGSTYGEVFADAFNKAQELVDGGMSSIEVQNQYYVVVNETEFHFGVISNKEMRSNVYVYDNASDNTSELRGWYITYTSGSNIPTVTRISLEFSSSGVTRTSSDRTSTNVSYAYLIRRAGA